MFFNNKSNLLIFKENKNNVQHSGGIKNKNGVPYGKVDKVKIKSLSIAATMKWITVLVVFLGVVSYVPNVMAVNENEYFPGLRRIKPSMQNWLQSPPDDEDRILLSQLSSIIEEQARRRFQQHLQQQQEVLQQIQQHQVSSPILQDSMLPPSNTEFSYDFPVRQIENLDEDIQFAVDPSDPRYYNSANENLKSDDAQSPPLSEDDYEEATGKMGSEDTIIKPSSTDDVVPYLKVKDPMHVNPKLLHPMLSSQSRDVMTREEINIMLTKLKEEKLKENQRRLKFDVVQKPMDVDNVMGMYIVALVAGISAAITVGLLSLGIAWYTLHKKTKAAADVDYPAYGVTGPNKECSPSGDRRLAQSAQMYHYQHQKQQIIAMENRSNNGDRNANLSDVESDDENEEGDYTVYECPGLAPTGEMEVKNPLFLDDPTPATPANPTTQQKQHTETDDAKTSKVVPPTNNNHKHKEGKNVSEDKNGKKT